MAVNNLYYKEMCVLERKCPGQYENVPTIKDQCTFSPNGKENKTHTLMRAFAVAVNFEDNSSSSSLNLHSVKSLNRGS